MRVVLVSFSRELGHALELCFKMKNHQVYWIAENGDYSYILRDFAPEVILLHESSLDEAQELLKQVDDFCSELQVPQVKLKLPINPFVFVTQVESYLSR